MRARAWKLTGLQSVASLCTTDSDALGSRRPWACVRARGGQPEMDEERSRERMRLFVVEPIGDASASSQTREEKQAPDFWPAASLGLKRTSRAKMAP
jgi:hypothetical protein